MYDHFFSPGKEWVALQVFVTTIPLHKAEIVHLRGPSLFNNSSNILPAKPFHVLLIASDFTRLGVGWFEGKFS